MCHQIKLFQLLCVILTVFCFNKNILDDSLSYQEFTAKAGTNITLSCPGINEHSLIFALEWRRSKLKLIEYIGESTTVWENKHRISMLPDTFALHFHPVIADDSEDYICLVNSRPQPDSVVTLIVQDVPDAPGRPLIMSFTSRSVNLSWAPSQNVHYNPIIHYIIHIRVGEDGQWDVANDIFTPDNSTTYQVTHLQPYTVYSFRVMAVNAMGVSAPSKASYYMVTLREVPAGKPTITTAHNVSSTALHISWRPPHLETIHGEFLGYRISYRPRDRGPESIKEIYIRDSTVESHTIQNLETYTQYLVSLQVFNPEGPGPSTTVLVMTDEGVPSKPLNLTVLGVNSTSINLGWMEPERANGAIDGYRIYFISANYTDYRRFNLTKETTNINYNLTDLKSNTEYKIWVKAVTQKFDGDPSEAVVSKTDVSGPSAPAILNLTCAAQDSIYVQWARPKEFYNSIDYYYIYYSTDHSEENLTLDASTEHLESATSIKNLSANTLYKIQIRAASQSSVNKSLFIKGDMSEIKKIFIHSDCDKIQSIPHSTTELNAGIMAGAICASFAFVLASIAFVLWRKCFHAAYYYLDDPPCNVPTALIEWNSTPEGSVEYKGAIPVQQFVDHCAELHADGDIGFSKEYEAIQTESSQEEYSSEHSQHPDNRAKNRYLNIIAYDHSRVQLLPIPGQKKSGDYINANYIDGFHCSRAYIGTQGPLPSTFDSFWRMIWEQKVVIIVMITNLVERGRRKCDMYWPKEGTEAYGLIQVKLIKEDVMATYTVRTFQIKHLKIKKKKNGSAEKIVYQYHYTNWPDHGTPDHPLPVLHFIKKSSAANPPNAGPIVVHCSAGVGRTGTYIVIDAMLKQIRSKNEVNIFGFLRHIRTQRNFLVQTEEQYIFIHDALLEVIESGETNIHKDHITKYICALQKNMQDDKLCSPWKPLEKQFQLVISFQCKDFHCVSANKPVNQSKNRSSDIIPVENSRVHLTPKPGEDGSDYINATWMQGFTSLREFIITQHPLSNTVTDFWQMVWDHNAQTLLMISTIDNQDFNVFWPVEENSIDSESYRVKLVGEHLQVCYITRDFIMQSLQDDYELHVRMIQCSDWPNNCQSVLNMFHFLNTVHDLHLGYQNGPIVVIDKYGGTEAATYCILNTLLKHLVYDNHADVYMYSKLYHNRRPGIWNSYSDYVRVHLASQAACNAPDLCAPINGSVSNINGTLSEHIRIPPEGMESSENHTVA